MTGFLMTRREIVPQYTCFDVETVSAPALEPAIVYSAQNSNGHGERIAIKKLREFEDKRYDLKTLFQRHNCLLEGIQWNRKFTYHGDYIGLGRIASEEGKQICFNQLIRYPESIGELDKDAEYAVLMNWLSHRYRLDNLLQQASEKSLTRHLTRLVHYIVDLHQNVAGSCSPEWGSTDKLWEKIKHNMELLEDVKYADGDLYKELSLMKPSLYAIFHRHEDLFRERFKWIKRCHGDLKCSNIWIAKRIHILDTIDFNSSYSNIDTISDFAMLVVDIQAHLLYLNNTMVQIDEHISNRCTMVAKMLIRQYFDLTDQNNEPSTSVLDFYLLEKAIVRSAISVAYDKHPELGWSYFRIAEMHLKKVNQQDSLTQRSANF